MTAATHVPPQNIEAEESVLGAMLVAEPALTAVLDEIKLSADDFYLEKHALIFGCIEGLHEAKAPVDELTVRDALGERTDEVGGKHYVSELAAKVPAAGNAKHYAEIVQQHAIARAKREIGQELQNGLAPCDAIERLRALGGSTGASVSTLTDFSQIIAKPVKFAWRDRIALGKITALAGRPKIGKGLLYSRLIAEVTRGTLDGDLSGPRRAIIVTTEDEPGDTLKPRLMAADADLERVSYFTMGPAEEPVPFRVPQDAAELGRRVAETGAALVVIDPLIEFIDGKTDSHKSQPVRQAVAALNAIARERGCAVLTIFHLNKGVSTDPLLRHEGSAAFTQIVRAGLMLGFDPDDPEGEEGDQRVLAVSSSNLAKLAPSLVYGISGQSVEGDTGEPITTAAMDYVCESTASSHELLGAREDEEQRTDRDEATEFLVAELADGPKSAKAIKGAAKTLGITEWPLKAAKKKLRVASQKSNFGGGWTWSLPEGDAGASSSDHVRENASPSSPSASRAKSQPPLRGEKREGEASMEMSPSMPCRYPEHRSSDYIGEGGRTICGTCHPKAGAA
jgi:putative DNA primase/helicase